MTGNHRLWLYVNGKMNLMTLLGLVEPRCCFNLVYTFLFENEAAMDGFKKKKKKSIVTVNLVNCDCNPALWWLCCSSVGQRWAVDSLKSSILEQSIGRKPLQTVV